MMSFIELFNFNSIKVQLELIDRSFVPRFELFQFHKGTIRTVKLIDSVCWLSNFNSIKVQLERFSHR